MGDRIIISKETISPAQCVIGFGIPTSEQKFREDYRHPKKDFAKMYQGIWPKYRNQFIDPYKNVSKKLICTKVNLIPELTFAAFREAFSTYRVVVLFSHWADDQVEFADRMVPTDEIIEAVPEAFDGVIDLCVCHPVSLAAGLRMKRAYCLSRFINREATPLLWLHYYQVLFEHLKRTPLTYLKATDDVIKTFTKD